MPDDDPNISHRIELRHERLQAQVEAQTANVERIENAVSINTEGIAELKVMQEKAIAETTHLCKAIDDVDKYERMRNKPLHEDLKERNRPLDWKGVLVRALAAVIAASTIGGVGWMLARLNGG